MQPKLIPDRDWLNDKMAVGNREIMEIYSNWYHSFVPMILSGVPIQPETLLAEYLTQNRVRYAPWGSEMEIIRPSGY